MKSSSFRSPPMVIMAQEFLDQMFWKLNRILDQEGVSVLQWAFMQRASLTDNGVSISAIIKATGESKDNVQRAAKSLEQDGVGTVIVNSSDRRARIFILTEFGRRRTSHVSQAFKTELLASIGAREIFSERAKRFTRHIWHASIYLASGDLAQKDLADNRRCNRAAVPDNSLRYVELPKRAKEPLRDSGKVPF